VKHWSLGMRYGMAAGFFVSAFLIRYALTPLLDHHSPFLFFLPAAMLAVLFGGLGPGLATLIAGLIVGDFFFLKPATGFGPPPYVGGYSVTELTALLSYLLTGAIAVAVIEGFRRTRIRLYETEAHEQSLERQVAERTASLEQSVKSLEGVLYHVAHDLRAPLRAMHSFSRLLLENYSAVVDCGGKGEDRLKAELRTGKDYARRISEASLKMDTLVRDLLDYGRLGHQELRSSTVDLWPLVHTVAGELNSEVESQRAEICVVPPSPQVQGDSQILAAVLKNLIENALKFVTPGRVPHIHIWAETEENRVRIYVKDNGIGIAPAYHERIFGVFERGPSSDNYPGTGIGLAIVQKGIERLGGRVGVQSNVGQGSRFWFELDAVPQTAKVPKNSTGQAEPFRGLLTALRSTLCLTQ
jgi:signal transduction histidine kinase